MAGQPIILKTALMRLAENSSRMSEIECRLSKYTYLSRNNLPGYPDGVVFRFLTAANCTSLPTQPFPTATLIPTSTTGTYSCASSATPPSTSGSTTAATSIPSTPFLPNSHLSAPIQPPPPPPLCIPTTQISPFQSLTQKTRMVWRTQRGC